MRKSIKPKRKREDHQHPTTAADQPAEGAPQREPAAEQPKHDELAAELEEERGRSAEIQEKYLRALADLDNFRKRTRAQMQAEKRLATQEVIVSMLSVADNLERAVETGHKGEDSDALLEGVKLTLKQCQEALAGFGVEPMEAVGHEFDPTVHEAVMQVPSSEDDDGKVVGEIQKGYKMGDTVIRPAQVQVGKAPETAEAASAQG